MRNKVMGWSSRTGHGKDQQKANQTDEIRDRAVLKMQCSSKKLGQFVSTV